MSVFSKLLLFIGVSMFFILPGGVVQAIVINYQATDLADTVAGEDLWQYTYTVSDHVFAADTGFTIYFDYSLYGAIDPMPANPNADWDVLTWDPDSAIPDDGAYDAYALVDNATLTDPFTVSFFWLGEDTPGAQLFDFYNGITWELLDFGGTAPAPSSVPEPTSMALLGAVLIVLATLRRRLLTN